MSVGLQSMVGGYIAAQSKRAERKVRPPLPVVTISRETGAGAVTIARMLAKRLDKRVKNSEDPPWTVFNRKLVERVLEDHELPATLKRFMPEDSIGDLQDAVEQQFGLHPANWTLVQHTTDTMMRLAHLGNVILVGRGSNIITAKVPGSLHVRLVAPESTRIAHVAEFYELSEKEAMDYVHKHDRARKRYVKRNFHAAIDDPLQYSLVINTARTGFDEAVRIIVDATPRVLA